jgi:hypothetical protein
MAGQLEVIKFRDLIPVTSIPRFVPDLGYLAIEVVGDDFSSVERIFINEVLAPEFIVLNKHRMYVQLPDAAYDVISSIEVVSSNFTRFGAGAKVSYELGDKTKVVSGILKLVQLFTKWMLQSPNSDIFNPERGGGLQELVGRLDTDKKMNVVLASVSRSVQNTVTQIRSAQSRAYGLPLSERLLSAEVTDFEVYREQMNASVKVAIQSAAGSQAVAALAL